jgi:hypothetical protein
VSDYLRTIALRTLAPSASIWPRPAAHFESPVGIHLGAGDPGRTPEAVTATASRGRAPDGPSAARDATIDTSVSDADVAPRDRRAAGTEPQLVDTTSSRRRSHRGRGDAPRSARPTASGPHAEGGSHRQPPTGRIDTTAPEPDASQVTADADPHRSPRTRPADDNVAAEEPTPETFADRRDPIRRRNEHPARLDPSAAPAAGARPVPRSPVRRGRAGRSDAPNITVTIGRVEVTTPAHDSAPTGPRIRRPALGLDEYLEDRGRS